MTDSFSNAGAWAPWLVFAVLVGGMLAIDLGVAHRKAHTPTRREAVTWTVVWVALSLAFNAGIYVTQGTTAGLEWTTGYLIEKSLSVDNVFIFLLIFSSLSVPSQYQHRVLFWGILGALVMRGSLIFAGAALLERFHWVIYFFGGLLVVTGIRFLRDTQHTPSVRDSRVLQFAKRHLRTIDGFEGARFFVRKNGVTYATRLFLALVLVETTDLIFAVDSIPAIFAVTDDPFIVLTSNVFALLGLRAMYFVLGGYLGELKYLKPALAAVLIFVGMKMLAAEAVHIHPLVSLLVIVGILAVAIAASVRALRLEREEEAALLAPPD